LSPYHELLHYAVIFTCNLSHSTKRRGTSAIISLLDTSQASVTPFRSYGMMLGFGMKRKPISLQSMIPRKAYAMLKDAFERHCI
jgi:hypothetical protein